MVHDQDVYPPQETSWSPSPPRAPRETAPPRGSSRGAPAPPRAAAGGATPPPSRLYRRRHWRLNTKQLNEEKKFLTEKRKEAKRKELYAKLYEIEIQDAEGGRVVFTTSFSASVREVLVRAIAISRRGAERRWQKGARSENEDTPSGEINLRRSFGAGCSEEELRPPHGRRSFGAGAGDDEEDQGEEEKGGARIERGGLRLG